MKISVIIPVYNSEKYLYRCLDSVINQTYSNWEVIAIDDGSKDNSYIILLDYASKDNRFNVFSQKNHGPGYTRNKAIEYVTGDFIVFLDSDDYLEVDYFENLAKNIRENNSDVIFIDVVQESPDGVLIKNEFASKYINSDKDTIIRHQMTGKLPWGGCRKVVRTELIVNNNIRYSDDVVGEEALFSLKVLLKATRVSFINKVCYHYINYPNSQSSKGGDDPWGGICKRINEYLKECDLDTKYNATINSFAYTSLIVSIYRITQNYHLCLALEKSEQALNSFKNQYIFLLDKDSLETRTKALIPLVKYNLSALIVIIAKLKVIISNIFKK